jgi:ATP-dependent helicase HrpA
MRHDAEGITTDRFRPAWRCSARSSSSPTCEPGEADDGVTLTVPLAMLNQIPANRCEWLVPGLLEEKVIALLAPCRKAPPPPAADGRQCRRLHGAFRGRRVRPDEPLIKMLQRFVEERVSLKLPMESFRPRTSTRTVS